MTTGPDDTALPPGPAGQAHPPTVPLHDGTRSAAPPGAGFLAAARWAGAHLTVVLPAAAAAGAYLYLSGQLIWQATLILTVFAAAVTWIVTHCAVHRDQFRARRARVYAPGSGAFPAASYGDVSYGSAGFPVPAGYEVTTAPAVTPFAAAKAAAAAAAAQQDSPPRPALPDNAAIIRAAAKLITDVQPGPERITAALPGEVQVQWDDTPRSFRDLDGARIDKMEIIVRMFRRAAEDAGLLHRFPQLWLISDTGAVIELFGDMHHGRTGVVNTTTRAATA
jgi:hypothetical protein